jgi:hypothetical protein
LRIVEIKYRSQTFCFVFFYPQIRHCIYLSFVVTGWGPSAGTEVKESLICV